MLCRSTGSGLCDPCLGRLRPAPDLGPPGGLDSCWSLLRYDDLTRDIVAALKFHNHRDAVAVLGAAMADLLAPHERRAVDVVTWAPTSAARRSARGYDQAELLARAVAGPIGRPCRPMLQRLHGAPQTGNDRAHRVTGPRFVARRPGAHRRSSSATSLSVLVVDDVRTTGSTLSAAAAALCSHHVDSVRAVGTVRGVTLAVVP